MRVAYDNVADKIYLLDANLKVIWRNSWNGVGNLPTSGWSTWVGSSQLPRLADAADQSLAIDRSGATPRIWLTYSVPNTDWYLLEESGGSVVQSVWTIN